MDFILIFAAIVMVAYLIWKKAFARRIYILPRDETNSAVGRGWLEMHFPFLGDLKPQMITEIPFGLVNVSQEQLVIDWQQSFFKDCQGQECQLLYFGSDPKNHQSLSQTVLKPGEKLAGNLFPAGTAEFTDSEANDEPYWLHFPFLSESKLPCHFQLALAVQGPAGQKTLTYSFVASQK